MDIKPHLLVVCGRNKKRSKTAEHIFKKDNRINIRSVGVSQQSDRKITEKDLYWADMILVMETKQRAKIWEIYATVPLPPLVVLDIPDEYEFMDEELVELLTEKINEILLVHYDL